MGCGHKFVKQLHTLCFHLNIELGYAREVAARAIEAPAEEVEPKPEWRKRKEDYIAHLPEASHSVRLVSASDKLHNAILRDYRVHGEKLWSRFSGGRPGTLWYYRELVSAFSKAEKTN